MGLKIIHTTCHTQFGGLEKRIYNESCWMAEKGHDIIIVAPPNTPLSEKSKNKGFATVGMAFKSSSFLNDFFKLRQLFRTTNPHILNTHGNEDSKIALTAAIGSGIPIKILSRHISAHVRNSRHNRILYKNLCHYIFTTADYTTRHLINTFHLSEEKVRTIASGIIPPEILLEKKEAKERLARELSLDPSASRFIGFVGRVSHDKGVDTLMNAFQHIAGKIPHHLVIVGKGNDTYLTELKKRAEDLKIGNRVHFTGFKEDVWPYYRAIECMVLASRDINGIPFEGIPQAVLESMYARCPVIGSRSGGIPDVIQHGSTGFLFPVEDHRELSDLLLQTLNNPLETQQRVENAFRMAADKHTLDAMGNKILDIFQKTLL